MSKIRWYIHFHFFLLVAVLGSSTLSGFSEETTSPLTLKIGRLLRSIGLEYEVTADPFLKERNLPDAMEIHSLNTLFNIVFPSQGLTYDMLDPQHIHLQPLMESWPGPEIPHQAIPKDISEIRKGIVLECLTVDHAIAKIQDQFGMVILRDYRIPGYRPIQGRIQSDSLENTLNLLCGVEDWQWFSVENLVVLLPGEKERWLGHPNVKKSSWIYADSPLEEVLTQLKSSFPAEITLSESLTDRNVTGSLKGATLGDIIEELCRLLGCSYQVTPQAIRLGRPSEFPPEEKRIAPTGVRVEMDILEIPQERWKELKINSFLTSLAATTPEKQENFWNQVRKTSGTQTFAKTEVLIPSGTGAILHFPLNTRNRSETEAELGYYFRIFPIVSDDNWIQIQLTVQFLEHPPSQSFIVHSSPYEIPLTTNLLVENGQRTLLHGASRTTKKDKINLFLISLRPTIEHQPIKLNSLKKEPFSNPSPFRIEVGGEIQIQGTYTSGKL